MLVHSKLKIGISRPSKTALLTEHTPKAMYYRDRANMDKQYTHQTEHFNPKLRTCLCMPLLSDPTENLGSPPWGGGAVNAHW